MIANKSDLLYQVHHFFLRVSYFLRFLPNHSANFVPFQANPLAHGSPGLKTDDDYAPPCAHPRHNISIPYLHAHVHVVQKFVRKNWNYKESN